MLESERIDAPKVELAAADFEGILLDGKPFRLSDQKGKVVFLNFWATWCAPCRKEMPHLDTLQSINKLENLSFFSRPLVLTDITDPHLMDIYTAIISLSATQKHVMTSVATVSYTHLTLPTKRIV